MQDQVGIIIDDKGQPILSAFTFPAWPSALAATGDHVLAVFQDAVHVYDLSSSELIQSLPLLPAQPVAERHQLRAVRDSSGPRVLIATSSKVRQCKKDYLCKLHASWTLQEKGSHMAA